MTAFLTAVILGPLAFLAACILTAVRLTAPHPGHHTAPRRHRARTLLPALAWHMPRYWQWHPIRKVQRWLSTTAASTASTSMTNRGTSTPTRALTAATTTELPAPRPAALRDTVAEGIAVISLVRPYVYRAAAR
jgi:hypothetical protein